MKANQVKPPTVQEHFEIPYEKREGTCHHCGSFIRATYGITIAAKRFCDHTCFANFAFPDKGNWVGGVT